MAAGLLGGMSSFGPETASGAAFTPMVNQDNLHNAIEKSEDKGAITSSLLGKIRKESISQGIDPALPVGIAIIESTMNPDIKDSKSGAIGLFQIEPKTAQELAKKIGYSGEINLRDLDQNIYFGVAYIKYLLGKTKNDPILTAVMYDAGPNHYGIKHYINTGSTKQLPKETQDYIKKMRHLGFKRTTS